MTKSSRSTPSTSASFLRLCVAFDLVLEAPCCGSCRRGPLGARSQSTSSWSVILRAAFLGLESSAGPFPTAFESGDGDDRRTKGRSDPETMPASPGTTTTTFFRERCVFKVKSKSIFPGDAEGCLAALACVSCSGRRCFRSRSGDSGEGSISRSPSPLRDSFESSGTAFFRRLTAAVIVALPDFFASARFLGFSFGAISTFESSGSSA